MSALIKLIHPTFLLSLLFLSSLTILGMVGVSFLPPKEMETKPIQPLLPAKVKEVQIETGYFVDHTFLGKVEARRSSELGFEQGGLLLKIRVNEGDFVKAGELLATLDTRLLASRRQELLAEKSRIQAQLDEMEAGPRKEKILAAKANVKQFEARLALAKLEQKRMKRLASEDVVAVQDFDTAFYTSESNAAQLKAAKENLNELLSGTRKEKINAQRAVLNRILAQIETIDVQLKKAQMKAPFSGTIVQRFTDEGKVIQAGTPVFKLIENQHLELRVGLSGQAANQLSKEKKYSVTIEKNSYQATLKAILPEREAKTRTVTTLFNVQNPASTLRSGDLAAFKISFKVENRGVFLPIHALTEGTRGLWACYVAEPLQNLNKYPNATHQITKRQVEVLHTFTDQVFVRGTLQKGELVIIEGLHRLVNEQYTYLK